MQLPADHRLCSRPAGTGWPDPAPATARHPDIAELTGLWNRSLLAWADEARDTTTETTWLQAGSWYADLRQPAGCPDFGNVSCLRDLSAPQVAWMARQEGFAGGLSADAADPACFTWSRLIDFEPFSGQADAGHLHVEGPVMVERGRDQPYLEHWHRTVAHRPDEAAAVSLVDRETGRAGMVLRVADDFAYVRDRLEPLAGMTDLAGEVARAGPRRAQDLVDCEISLGEVTAEGWVIRRSSLPFREGRVLSVSLPAPAAVRIPDSTPEGRPVSRTWTVVGRQGDLTAAPSR